MALPRFKVEIQGEGLERARDALNAAGVPTIGPTSVGREGESEIVGRTMYAVLTAPSAAEAQARVSEALPGDLTVSPAEPLE
jgi:hypothetical protein